MRIQKTAAILLVAATAGLGGCDLDLDLTNPNSPTEQQVLTSIEGIIALAVAMQGQAADAVITYTRAPALVTDEWSTRTAALAADQSLVIGVTDPEFGVVSGPFAATYRISRSANDLIANAGTVGLGQGFQAGITALAKLHKAMALGMAIQQYERIPVNASLQGAVPQPREVVLDTVLSLLESARSDLAGNPDLSGFRSRVLGPGFNLENTINAMLARYYLIDGQYQNAIAAADRVDLTVRSVYRYGDPNRNPIYNYHFGLNYAAARASFVAEAEPGDRRAPFWVDTTAAPFVGNPPTIPLLPIRQYSTRNDEFPVYLPGEMLLIKAEAYARLGNLDQARALINQVRTKLPTATTPGAALPAKTAAELNTLNAVLRQIAYERRYELYMQGLRWEDMRRLDAVIDEEPSMQWLPYPSTECQANPADPCG